MKNKTFRFAAFCWMIAASLLVTCDPFREEEMLVMINTSATDYYILPNSSTVIDLKAIVSSSFTNISIKILEYPKRGTLTSFGDLIFKYTPSPSFTEDGYGKPDGGTDQFKVGFTSDNKRIATQAVTVHMTHYTGYFPCSLIGVEDAAATMPGTPVSIKVIFNDRLCGIRVDDVKASITVSPKYGQARVNSDAIIYTPGNDFIGFDEIVYKISASTNQQPSDADGLLVSYGLVKIEVGE